MFHAIAVAECSIPKVRSAVMLSIASTMFVRIIAMSSLVLALVTSSASAGDRPVIMVHYMPWFSAKTPSQPWGWHWTMNARDPEKSLNGNREIASHYYPLIGPYDSADPHLLEYHALLIKIAGIDGVIADWYGPDDLHDYATIHRATEALFNQARRAGLKFAVCYEDQTITAFKKAGRLDDPVAHARRAVKFVTDKWTNDPAYLTFKDRPALFVFGPQGLTAEEWTRVLATPDGKTASGPLLLTLHRSVGPAQGVFDWPVPQQGSRRAAERFLKRVAEGNNVVPVAFPRFHDYYAQAGRARRGYALH